MDPDPAPDSDPHQLDRWDPDPDPHQNVLDPPDWFGGHRLIFVYRIGIIQYWTRRGIILTISLSQL